jgi:hypothetical protein
VRAAGARVREEEAAQQSSAATAAGSAARPPNRASPSFTTWLTSPRQHAPLGLLTSQAHRPARTWAVIDATTVDFPVHRISSQALTRVCPKQ